MPELLHRLSQAEGVRSYCYKPEPIFYGAGTRYLGVELEIDGAGESSDHARKIQCAGNRDCEHIYIKHDGSKACDEVLEQYFHKARKDSMVPLIGFDEKLNRRAELLDQIAELEKEQKQIEQEVKLFMQDNEIAASDSYRVMWSNVETARLATPNRRKVKHPIRSNGHVLTLVWYRSRTLYRSRFHLGNSG